MKATGDILKFGSIQLPVTHSDKIFWPEEGITKGMVVAYYQSIADHILPFLKNRPESLFRNPDGINNKGFFHKDAGKEAPDWIKTFNVYSESSDKTVHYILCNNKATLAYLNNLGCIEFNPWSSTVFRPDYPDYLIIDIDPSPHNTFEEVMEVAKVCRDIFARAKVTSYCKTSGADGMHIYVPMGRRYKYAEVKNLAHLVCLKIQQELSSTTTLERHLSKRGRKIYLDYLQNSKGQTIASVFSVRPRKGATVSMPLDWKELKQGLTPQDFTIYNAPRRILRKKGMFTEVLGKGNNLEKCLQLLGE